jgi:valyl-tRNA synthetase
LWHQLPQKAGAKSIALDCFPEARDEWKNEAAQERFSLPQEVITGFRNIRAEIRIDAKKKVNAEFTSTNASVRTVVEENRDGILRLATLSDLRISADPLPQAGGALRSTAQFDVRIAYSDAVDVAAEKAKLQKEIDGLKKAIAAKEVQLANETFRSKAPEKIIRGLEETLAAQRIELKKLEDRLGQL